MKSTRNGLFIALEGPDGGGKSTILKMLNEAINNDYTQLKVVITREPGGTNNAIAEDIRNILLNKPGVSIDYYAEALLFAASRSQHVSDFISPNLELGNIVITDRYVLSSLAYQGVGRDLGIDQVWKINQFAMKGIIPDLTLLLMINPKDGMQRILATRTHEINRLDQEVDTFKNKVYQAYETILKDDEISQHVVKIDANRDLQTVFQDCYQVVKKLINEKYPQ